MSAREEEIWDILTQHGIKRPDRLGHGPCVMALSRCVIIIGKQWVPACEAALTAAHLKFRTLDNQIVIGNGND